MEGLFAKAEIRSLYSNMDQGLWSETWNYLKESSSSIDYRHYRLDELFSGVDKNACIGGFAESIILSLIANVVYDTGKYLLTDLLSKVREAADQQNHSKDPGRRFTTAPLMNGIAKIKVTFADGREVLIEVPYLSNNGENIGKMNYAIIESQFLEGKLDAAVVHYDESSGRYCSGHLFDRKV